jgi:hypothetical protein
MSTFHSISLPLISTPKSILYNQYTSIIPVKSLHIKSFHLISTQSNHTPKTHHHFPISISTPSSSTRAHADPPTVHAVPRSLTLPYDPSPRTSMPITRLTIPQSQRVNASTCQPQSHQTKPIQNASTARMCAYVRA